MFEILVAAGVVLVIACRRPGSDCGDPETLLAWSATLIAAGFAVGLPAGLGYHIRLGRVLAAAGRLERRWWLRPTDFHDSLTDAERRSILPWFRVGAAGFLLVTSGCALLFALALQVAL